MGIGLKDFEELVRNNERYENLKADYSEICALISQGIESLEAAQRKLNPTQKIRAAGSRSDINYKEIVEEFYSKMNNGLELTKELIDNTYQEWKESSRRHLFNMIKELPGVESRKDISHKGLGGKPLILYLRRER